MILDTLNFSNNLIIGLPREFINSCKAEIIVITPFTSGLVTTATEIPKQDLTNCLLTIRFAADSTHMESLTRTGNDAIWITNGFVQIVPFHAATTRVNVLPPRGIVFSSVCDWNLIIITDNHPYNDHAMLLMLPLISNLSTFYFCNQDEILTLFKCRKLE
jgi:hypothetical protein